MHPAADSARATLTKAAAIARMSPRALFLPFLILGMVQGLLDSDAGLAFHYFGRFPTSPGGVQGAMLDGLQALAGTFLIVYAALAVLFSLIVARAAFMPIRGEGAPDASAAFQAIRPVYLKGVFTLVPATLVVALGFLILFVPGVLLVGVFIALPAVVVAEGAAFIGAMTRSYEIARTRFWDATLLALVPIAVALVPAFGLGWIPVLGSIIAGAAQGLALAAASVISTVYYADALRLPDATPATSAATTTGEAPAGTTTPPTPTAPPDTTSQAYRR